MQNYERLIALTGARNVRDLGGYPAGNGGLTRWRSVLRGDALHALSAADIEALIAHGVTTVIDLRNPQELAREANPFTNDARVQYDNVALFSALAPVEMMAAQSPHFDMGDRYCQALDNCQPAIAKVLRTIAHAPEGIVLFHCTAGKDRTGIIAALMLAHAGVDDAVIIEDYALTGSIFSPLLADLHARAVARGIPSNLADAVLASAPHSMARTLGHLARRYGGVDSYLTKIGLSQSDIASLERRLCV
ncbi:protein-tyrosine phosphatase [Rhizobium sp. BK529]|uniref:tyrosine-protein phosphatase n=1 Tax=unclassified Rhizobium TaxID=2613769 RepID=UPI00104AF826|nr:MULTISPECIES: tyrosine-protein phosphatase [unclassified Rhizobium]MBB3593676.1 protein-tyrosine phosphatase [Rhizobium sp. BK529]TCS03464.1 protein-tyrosine phosphatase [Rhizobium sp. BK418]